MLKQRRRTRLLETLMGQGELSMQTSREHLRDDRKARLSLPSLRGQENFAPRIPQITCLDIQHRNDQLRTNCQRALDEVHLALKASDKLRRKSLQGETRAENLKANRGGGISAWPAARWPPWPLPPALLVFEFTS
eukprot:g6213.t1